MKKTILLNDQLLETYAESLGLQWRSDNDFPLLILTALAMQVLSSEVSDGYFLARQSFCGISRALEAGGKNVTAEIKKRIHKQNNDYLTTVLTITDPGDDQKLLQIETVLVKPKDRVDLEKHQENPEAEQDSETGRMTLAVSPDSINRYCELTGDANSIHQGKRPVVPGMLLMLLAEDLLMTEGFCNKDLLNSKIQYRNPVYSDQEVEIRTIENGFEGWTKDLKVFSINY